MRKIILIALSLLTGCASYMADYRQVPSSEMELQTIFTVPGKSKDQIFNESKAWIAKNFKSAKAVIEYENREEGKLIGNGIVMTSVNAGMTPVNAVFTLEEDIKPEKVRFRITNVAELSGYPFTEKFKRSVMPILQQTLDNLQVYLLKPTDNKDW